MNIPTFREIPPITSFVIPFEINEESLIAWLSDLSKRHSREACHLLLAFLQIFNKTGVPIKTRLACLKICHEYLKHYISELENAYWDANLPLSSKEQDHAEAVAWNYQALAEGFLIEAKAKAKETTALAFCCHCLQQAQLHIAAVYHRPNAFFWTMTYQLYLLIEKQQLFHYKSEEPDFKDLSLNAMLTHILIFQICNATQFRPRDIQTVFQFLPLSCADLTIYKLTDVKFQTEVLEIPRSNTWIRRIDNTEKKLIAFIEKKIQSPQNDLLVFNVDQAIPPTIINQSYRTTAPSLRYFTTASVLKNLERLLVEGEMWRGVLKSINNNLVTRVIKTLAPRTKLRDSRIQTEKACLGVIGFDAISVFLYKVSQPKQKALQEPETLTGLSSYEELTQYAGQGEQKINHFGGFFDIDFEQFDILDTPWNQTVHTDITQQSVVLKRLTIFDTSERGYAVHWTDKQNAKAKVGEIFGLISEDQTRLEIAIIRRIISHSPEKSKFGTEVLGTQSELVMITDAENHSAGKWGIFLSGNSALQLSDSLIYTLGHFQEGDEVCLYTSKKIVKAQLKKSLNATTAILHVALEY